MISYQNYELKDLVIKILDKTLPNNEYNLKQFSINSEVNKHTILKMRLELFTEEINSYIQFNRTADSEVIIAMNTLFEEKNEEILFFVGHTINSIFYKAGKNRKFLEIEAVSVSEKMDRTKKFRAFQKTTLTYTDVINQIFDDYSGIPAIFNSDKLKDTIKAPLIQFKETDWEFLIRVLSRVGIGAFNLPNGSISLGFINTDTRRKKYEGNHGYLGHKRERNQPMGYIIQSEQSYSLGDVIDIKTEDFTGTGNVDVSSLEYINGKFLGKYQLQQRDYTYPYISNKKIAGCVIEANVERVFERDDIAVMEVNLSIGLSKYASTKSRTNENLKEYPDNRNGRFIFPYTTPYSQSNTGYFCTPETNDVVAVYFPMDEEEYGYVLWAINNPGNGRFSNPNVRNYTTPIESKDPAYFDFKLNYEKFNIYAEKLIDMKTTEELNLKSENIMTMRSKNEYTMAVEENMSISGKNMSIKSNKTREVVLEERQEIIENLTGKYISKYRINAKDMETVVQGKSFTQAPKIFKKS